MNLSALTRKSIADVTRRKGRTVLVVLGILIGVCGFTAINVMQDAITNGIAYSHEQSTQPDLSFDVDAVNPSLIPALEAVPNVATMQLQSRSFGAWFVGSARRPASAIEMIGYPDPQHVALGHFQLLEGHYPGPGEIVLEAGDAGLASFQLGDSIHILGQQQGDATFKVVGLSQTIGLKNPSQSGTARGYIQESELESTFGPQQTNDIEVKVHDTAHAQQALNGIDTLLQQHHVNVQDKTIDDNSNTPNASTSGLLTVLRIILILAMGLGALLIVNTIVTLLLEQIRIIGTMKALGGTRGAIIRSYVISVGAYAMLGTVLGIGLGIFAGYELAAQILTMETYSMGPFTIAPTTLAISLLPGLGVPFLAALLPLWNGTRITVHQSLAAYGISTGNSDKSGQMRRVRGPLFTRIPQTFWLGLCGLFRRRQRAITTLTILTPSSLAFLSVATAIYSVSEKSNHILDNYDFDLNVQVLNGTQPWTQLRDQIQAIPNVQRVERLNDDDFIKTTWGTMRLVSVETDIQMYQRHLVSGRWFSPNERHVALISDDAASATGLKAGDTLTFSSGDFTGEASWKIIGIVHDPRANISTAGLVVTTSENYNQMVGWSTTAAKTVDIRATDRSSTAVATLEQAIGNTLRNAGIQIGLGSRQDELNIAQSQFTVLYVMLYAPTIVIALMSCLALYHTLITSVLERRREIGIWRSMGARDRQVGLVFLVEAQALASLTWALSTVLGVPVAYGFLRLLSKLALFNIPFAFNPLSLGIMLVAVLVIAALASLAPAQRAASLRIANILRYE